MAARTLSVAALGLVGVLATSFGAVAQELVVMPFHCRPSAIGAMLTPADNIGHRLIGRRETTTFTACSPVRPDQCRRWTVHRFDMECGGVPVAWTDVVAAGAARPRSAWVEDGVFHLRMPNWWGLPPDDPCASGPLGPEDRWRPGLARQCAMRAGRLSVVTFPPGFAPTLDLDAIFVGDRGGSADAGTGRLPPVSGSARSASPAPPVDRPLPGPTDRPSGRLGADRTAPEAPLPERTHRETPKAAPAPAPHVASAAQPPAPTPAPAAPPERAAKVPANDPPPPRPASPASGEGARVIPKIINAEPSAAADRAVPSEPPTPPTPSPAVAASASPPVASAPAEPPPAAAPLPVTAPSEAVPTPVAQSLPSMLVAGLAAGAVALLVLAGIVLARRGGPAPVERDLASVRFQSAQGRQLIVPEESSAAVPERGPPPPASPLGDRVPTNPAEALAVLGMGIAPDTDIAAVKRLVDALRFSWHPDRAENDQDRALRVLRLQQINAAWEILARGPGGGSRPS
jgi:hypothetical protein